MLGSGPILFLDVACLNQTQGVAILDGSFLPPKVNKMKVRFWTKMAFSFGPKLVQSLTFTLVPNLTFKNGPSYRHLLFQVFCETTITIVSQRDTLEKGNKTGKHTIFKKRRFEEGIWKERSG